MAVTLYTDRRMIEHRVPGPAPRAPRAADGDPAASGAIRVSQHMSFRTSARGNRRGALEGS